MSKVDSRLFDPLNPVTDEFLRQPYPTFEKLRKEASIFWSEKGKYWLVLGYEIGNEITRDLRFEKRLERWNQIKPITRILPGPAHLIKTRQHWILNENPPAHTHLRSLVNKAFSPRMVLQMQEKVQAVADKLINIAMPAGKMEFIGEFAFLLPITVICEMLGIPADDHEMFRSWSNTMSQTLEPGATLQVIRKSNKAHDQLAAYLKPLLAQRRKLPQDDLISALVEAEIDGEKLGEDDIVGNVILMLVAGHETTVNLIGNGMLALLKHRDQFEQLQKNPDLIDSAIEEFLRYDGPVQTVRRLVGEDMEFHGQKMKKGDMVVVLLGACNRDPAVFVGPDKLDITRKENKHIAFSSGIHHCLGVSLARMEARIAINTVLRRLPNIRLADQILQYKHPFNLRGVKEMHVVFD